MFLYFKTAAKVVIISKPPNKYVKNKLFQVFGGVVDAGFLEGLTALGAGAAGAAVLLAKKRLGSVESEKTEDKH